VNFNGDHSIHSIYQTERCFFGVGLRRDKPREFGEPPSPKLPWFSLTLFSSFLTKSYWLIPLGHLSRDVLPRQISVLCRVPSITCLAADWRTAFRYLTPDVWEPQSDILCSSIRSVVLCVR